MQTKAGRLTQLKEEEKFYKVLDKIFYHDWKLYVKGIMKENAVCNKRLCRVLVAIKGKAFVSDLLKLMTLTKTKGALIYVARKPTGILFKERRVASIPEIWVDQKIEEDGPTGCFYVQVEANRWLKIHF